MPWMNDEHTLMIEKGARGNDSWIYNPASLIPWTATHWAGARCPSWCHRSRLHDGTPLLQQLLPSGQVPHGEQNQRTQTLSVKTEGKKPNQPTNKNPQQNHLQSVTQERYSTDVMNLGQCIVQRFGWAWERVHHETPRWGPGCPWQRVRSHEKAQGLRRGNQLFTKYLDIPRTDFRPIPCPLLPLRCGGGDLPWAMTAPQGQDRASPKEKSCPWHQFPSQWCLQEAMALIQTLLNQ